MKRVHILIMAKAPIEGFCKTRLIPALGERGATALARSMLVRTADAALAAGLGCVELCVAPGLQAFDWDGLRLPGGLTWTEQGEGDLGARMARAAQRVMACGQAILLIGTDCPALDSGVLQSAAAALDTHDASMVPTADGGYALLGLNRFSQALFEGMAWSTASVAADTRQRLAALQWTLLHLPTLHDIDEPADLPWLPADLQFGLPNALPYKP